MKCHKGIGEVFMINRPNVARAVLQTTLSLTDPVKPGMFHKHICH